MAAARFPDNLSWMTKLGRLSRSGSPILAPRGGPCPACKRRMVKRYWKGNPFWGCANFPRCRMTLPYSIVPKRP